MDSDPFELRKSWEESALKAISEFKPSGKKLTGPGSMRHVMDPSTAHRPAPAKVNMRKPNARPVDRSQTGVRPTRADPIPSHLQDDKKSFDFSTLKKSDDIEESYRKGQQARRNQEAIDDEIRQRVRQRKNQPRLASSRKVTQASHLPKPHLRIVKSAFGVEHG